MPKWKLTIFVNAIKARMVQESREPEDIIVEYIKLTEDEQTEILEAIQLGAM